MTPSKRMHSPTPIPPEALAGAGSDEWEAEHAHKFGSAPDTWEEWTYQAEQGLLRTLGIAPQEGEVYRGGPVKYSP